MMKRLALAALAAVVMVGSASAQDKDSPKDVYLKAVKACLLKANVPLTGDRPGCYMDDDMHLHCLGAYKDAGAQCRNANLPKPQGKVAKW